MKSALRRTVRDILIVASLLCMLYGGARLWSELQESAASDYAIPTLPAAQGEDADDLPRVDFPGLRGGAPGALAWITVPETQINYPVVQWTDNKRYLDITAAGQPSRYGAIFMDYRNSADFSDFYTIIYGHNMRNGKMFGTLKSFRESAFFDRVKYGFLQTPEKTYRLEFFAWTLSDAAGEYYKNLLFFVPGEKEAFLEMMKETAGRWREIPLGPEDRILALSTCSYATGDERTIVLAKLVEIA